MLSKKWKRAGQWWLLGDAARVHPQGSSTLWVAYAQVRGTTVWLSMGYTTAAAAKRAAEAELKAMVETLQGAV
jgi:hypothetical protein